MNFDQINDQTGFANGDTFASEQDVREYFTVANITDMFGDSPEQSVLTKMANIVIANEWHCEFVTAKWLQDQTEAIRVWLSTRRDILSLGGIAKRIGVTQPMLSMFANGKTGMSANNLQALIMVLKRLGYGTKNN